MLTHTLWGGRYNPIIVVDDIELGEYLVECFRVDALYPIIEDETVKNFIGKFPHLPWPNIHKSFFIQGSSERMATFVDAYHPIRRIYENEVRRVQNPDLRIHYYKWDANDPLYDVLLSMYGTFVMNDDILIDYSQFLRNLPIDTACLTTDQPLPAESYNEITINTITSYGLISRTLTDIDNAGFYLGDVGNFDDIVNYWNLRAADLDVIFYDPNHANRFSLQKDSFLQKLRARPERHPAWPNRICVWFSHRNVDPDLTFVGSDAIQSHVDVYSWNGLNIKPRLISSKIESVLGTINDSNDALSTTFQLPEKPFYDDHYLPSIQKVVVTIRPFSDYSFQKTLSLKFPYLPELNEFLGRSIAFSWDSVRSEPGGIALISTVAANQITFRSISSRSLIAKVFQTYGFESTLSKPGLIAFRIIEQMGGLQDCRVFKITGVRNLIESYSYLQSFSRTAAIQKIGRQDPSSGRFDFDDFKRLFIEARDKNDLHPEDALKFLVKKGVFRVGLKFVCTNCQLDLWTSIDDVGTTVVCEYCGKDFNVTPQLKDRDWAYRKSGLFGKDDHQEGAIPVVVTLQQLDTFLSFRWFIYTTAMKLKSPIIPNKEHECELDFVLFTEGFQGKSEIAFGECKTNKPITAQDVENLKIVADSLPLKRIDPYIVFAKMAPFTNEEIELCKQAQSKHRWRVIMLSDRELEPYNVYERARDEFEIDSTAISLEDLAKVTQQLYFNPKRKRK